jgi:hypothetical protein
MITESLYKLLGKFLFVLLLVGNWGVVTAQTEPAELALTPEQAATEEIKKTIAMWAGAWQSQLPDLYIAHYTLDYVAPGFASREEWLANRRVRLVEPEFINIRLIDFELISLDENKATTRFTIIYERHGYSDETYKELLLNNSSGFWLIEVENSLEVRVL